MTEKILFVSSADKTLALYYDDKIFDIGIYFDVNLIGHYLARSSFDKIGVYSLTSEPQIIKIAETLKIPVLVITDVLSENYATDILTYDIDGVKNSAAYMGIFEEHYHNASLMAKIYQQVKKDKKVQTELFTEDKSFTLRNHYEKTNYNTC